MCLSHGMSSRVRERDKSHQQVEDSHFLPLEDLLMVSVLAEIVG